MGNYEAPEGIAENSCPKHLQRTIAPLKWDILLSYMPLTAVFLIPTFANHMFRCYGTGTQSTPVGFPHLYLDYHSQEIGFISSSWHITSNGMFAGSCIGVILLVITLEFLRRSAKEYDRYTIRQFQRAQSYAYATPTCPPTKASDPSSSREGSVGATRVAAKFRPNVMQQAIRAT